MALNCASAALSAQTVEPSSNRRPARPNHVFLLVMNFAFVTSSDCVRNGRKREIGRDERRSNHHAALETSHADCLSQHLRILQQTDRTLHETEVHDGPSDFSVLNQEHTIARQSGMLQRLLIDEA